MDNVGQGSPACPRCYLGMTPILTAEETAEFQAQLERGREIKLKAVLDVQIGTDPETVMEPKETP